MLVLGGTYHKIGVGGGWGSTTTFCQKTICYCFYSNQKPSKRVKHNKTLTGVQSCLRVMKGRLSNWFCVQTLNFVKLLELLENKLPGGGGVQGGGFFEILPKLTTFFDVTQSKFFLPARTSQRCAGQWCVFLKKKTHFSYTYLQEPFCVFVAKQKVYRCTWNILCSQVDFFLCMKVKRKSSQSSCRHALYPVSKTYEKSHISFNILVEK